MPVNCAAISRTACRRAGTTWRAGSGMPDREPFDTARDITSPPWTAVLFRAEVFARTGVLEEAFESYLEDADFGLRCAGLGIRGRYIPEARAVHVAAQGIVEAMQKIYKTPRILRELGVAPTQP